MIWHPLLKAPEARTPLSPSLTSRLWWIKSLKYNSSRRLLIIKSIALGPICSYPTYRSYNDWLRVSRLKYFVFKVLTLKFQKSTWKWTFKFVTAYINLIIPLFSVYSGHWCNYIILFYIYFTLPRFTNLLLHIYVNIILL